MQKKIIKTWKFPLMATFFGFDDSLIMLFFFSNGEENSKVWCFCLVKLDCLITFAYYKKFHSVFVLQVSVRIEENGRDW